MPTETQQFCFKSDMFSVDPKEDEETNPFCYGRELAIWIAARFKALAYEPEEVIAEDWGWCVMLRREPFLLWVGCGNFQHDFYEKVSEKEKATFVPDGTDLTWTCFVGSDTPLWTAFFWKQLFGKQSTAKDMAQVERELETILKAEPRIRLVEHP